MPAVTVPLLDVSIATPRSRLLAIDVRGVTFDYLPGQALLIGEHIGWSAALCATIVLAAMLVCMRSRITRSAA